MRKLIIILICFFVANVQSFAQRKRTIVTPPTQTISIDEAINQYRFDEAEQILKTEIETLAKKKQSTDEAEERLHAIERAQSRLHATEQVVFIDSLVISKEELFNNIHLSDEVGTVESYSTFFKVNGNTESSVYLSQMKDKVYYSESDNSGNQKLYTRDLIGTEWSTPIPLKGLSDLGDLHQNYPYMLSDGITLYYSAQGSESFGGYDIFMTRYDADSHEFLTPENIGMPFNSPANDYLYMIDDYLNLGYFVTDRNQPEGKVCIYTFIPNETRKVYDINKIGLDKLRSYARLNSIKETWPNNKSQIEEYIAKLQKVRENNSEVMNDEITQPFAIRDGVSYNKANNFKNNEAREKYVSWLENQAQLVSLEQSLEVLRKQYHNSDQTQQQQLSEKILNQEKQIRQLKNLQKKQAKEIRSLES